MLFFEQMYEDKKWLLQEPSRELVKYVVKRFDPDPEAGARWNSEMWRWPCVVSSPNVTGKQLSVSHFITQETTLPT